MLYIILIFVRLRKHGGPFLRSAEAAALSAMFRTAHVTVQNWPQWLEQIEDAARQSLPVHRVAEGNFYPSFWDSPPLALNLMNASTGFPTHPKWSGGGADALVLLSASPPPIKFRNLRMIAF